MALKWIILGLLAIALLGMLIIKKFEDDLDGY
jgi:hypothetical protein